MVGSKSGSRRGICPLDFNSLLVMGYVLSWDLVQWVVTSDMVRSQAKGVEDVTTGNWLNKGNKAKNRVNIYPRMYDYKSAQPQDFLNDTIGVHQLKEDIRWAHTLEHFNATRFDASSRAQQPLAS